MHKAGGGGNDATRQALLRAARERFASQGLALTRVRDIAARAGVGVSAVNYHFGSKQGLYLAVMQSEARGLLQRHPMPSPAERLDAEARLGAVVRVLIDRFLGDEQGSLLPRLLVREMSAPTPAFDRLVEEFSRPQFLMLGALMRELLGPHASTPQLRAAGFSLLSQVVFYLFAQPLVLRLAPEALAGPAAHEQLAGHITQFSLAALRGMRATIEKEAAHA